MTDSQSVRVGASAKRRKSLLDAARTLFLARGYADTSVSAIVRSAGVAQGTFYLYFKSKQQVLPHLRADVLADYLATFEHGIKAKRKNEAADHRLVRGLAAIHASVAKNRELVRLFRQATTSDELDRVWIEGRETLAAPLSSLIEVGIEQGHFAADDPRMAALLALAIFDDILYEALEYGKPADAVTTLAHGTRFLLRALRCPENRIHRLVKLPS